MAVHAELDTLVIRNIGDIEAAMKHAVEVLGPRLWDEVGKAVIGGCEASNHYASAKSEDEEVWLADRSWLVQDTLSANADADFWLALDERTGLGGEGEGSWLASFTASGPNGATVALWVHQNIVGVGRWKKIVRSADDVIDELRAAGFDVVEDDDRRLCIPVMLDREAVATAFSSEDFVVAMQPLTEAVRKAITATPLLDRLRALALAAA